MTATATTDARMRCIDAGMNDFISKPRLIAIDRAVPRGCSSDARRRHQLDAFAPAGVALRFRRQPQPAAATALAAGVKLISNLPAPMRLSFFAGPRQGARQQQRRCPHRPPQKYLTQACVDERL